MAYDAIEASYIGQQLKDDIGRMVSNMRDNATGYKADGQSGRLAAEELAAIMTADANGFLLRIQRMVNLAQRNNAKYQAALASNGWTAQEATDLRSVLVGVCNHTKAAPLTTVAEIEAECDYILTTVPVFERVF